jgi:hypothetical protein
MHFGMNHHQPYGKTSTLFVTTIFSMIMELADESDVYKKIVDSQASKVYLKEKFVWKVFIQILKGL